MPQHMVVAAFFTNTQDFQTLRTLGPTVDLVVLDLNVWNQNIPTDPYVIENWQRTISGYQTAGIRVLGYIPTDDGTAANSAPTLDGSAKAAQRTLADLTSFVDLWYSHFNVLVTSNGVPVQPDGIFFDEGPYPWRFTGCQQNTMPPTLCQDVKNFYSALYQYVKTKPTNHNLVLLNAAGYSETDDWIMTRPAADIALLWEATATQYLANFPAQPPAWWTNPLYAPDRVAHTVYDCASPLPPVNSPQLCQVVAQSKLRGAGHLYVYDGNSSAYNHLPPYWKQEIAAIALRDDNDVYVRDWTDSPSSYDQGIEPSSRAWWITSDVWNRTSNIPPAGGFFNSNDQPISQDPVVSLSGTITNYAFARLQKKPCGALSVDATFLWADFGTGSNFSYVSAAPTANVAFNVGDTEMTTPAVAWSLPSTVSTHLCLAVEVVPVPPQLVLQP